MIDGFITKRLSRQLFLMTIAFIMVAEIVIFIPSAAMYRQDWLMDRAKQAGHMSLALTGVPDYEASEFLSGKFMADTDIIMLAARRQGMTELLLGMPPDTQNLETIDLRTTKRLPEFTAMFRSFLGSSDGHLRVIISPLIEGQEHLEYIVPKSALKQALQAYCHNILLLSVIIAVITGTLLFLALSALIVRPIKRLARGLAVFREDPETRKSNLPPTRRKDEIGDLQREFFEMKESVRHSLRQQDRLATLGLAVAKINHDLRNVLTSAQLVSDRIAMDKDERVSKMGERLVRAVDRGVRLCADVLNFSQPEADPPEQRTIRISSLAGEVAADVLRQFEAGPDDIDFTNKIDTDLTVTADPDHTYRILHNLFRNAAQAMSGKSEKAQQRRLTVSAKTVGGIVTLLISDTGPGLPNKAKDNLFTAFASSSGHGSTGLGLTISKELARDQGGDLALSESGENGTTFALTFPPKRSDVP